jgi:hypothetical protein
LESPLPNRELRLATAQLDEALGRRGAIDEGLRAALEPIAVDEALTGDPAVAQARAEQPAADRRDRVRVGALADDLREDRARLTRKEQPRADRVQPAEQREGIVGVRRGRRGGEVGPGEAAHAGAQLGAVGRRRAEQPLQAQRDLVAAGPVHLPAGPAQQPLVLDARDGLGQLRLDSIGVSSIHHE